MEALSGYLLTLFTEWSKRFTGLTPDVSLLFERFEMLGSFILNDTRKRMFSREIEALYKRRVNDILFHKNPSLPRPFGPSSTRGAPGAAVAVSAIR